MKNQKRSKASFGALPLTLAILSILTFTSCGDEKVKPDISDVYKEQIEDLRGQISDMKDNQAAIESEYKDKIDKLESDLSELENEVPKESESESETAPAEKDFFGFKYRQNNGYAMIISYDGESKDVIIPSVIDGLKVKEIGNSAFENSDIRSVSIPETVESIGWFAFKGCKNLRTVILPESVLQIGYQAFDGCDLLTLYVTEGSYGYKYGKSYGIKLSVS